MSSTTPEKEVSTTKVLEEVFPTLPMLNDAQLVQVIAIWESLPVTMGVMGKRAWMCEVSDDGFTRLGRVVTGEGEVVLGEAVLREKLDGSYE